MQRERGEVLLPQPSAWDRNRQEREAERKLVRQSVGAGTSSCFHEAFYSCDEILDRL